MLFTSKRRKRLARFRVQPARNSFSSVRGRGGAVRGRPASGGVERSASNSSIQRCWTCQLIMTAGERTARPVTPLAGSRCDKLTAKSTSQTAASPVQIRRLGRINSRHTGVEPRSSQETNPAGRFCGSGFCLRNPATTAARMASSLGSAARWRSNKISRGVFMRF